MELLHIINIILIILYTIFLCWMWKKTRLDGMLILAILSWLEIMIKIMYLDTLPILPLILVVKYAATTAYASILAYQDKLYAFTGLYMVFFTLVTIMVVGLGWRNNGEIILPVMILLWLWYKSTPRCFNPVICPIYKLDKL